MSTVGQDSRSEAAPDDVARWCEAVMRMPAEELEPFERRICRAFQHYSLVELKVAITSRREQLESDRWYRVRQPTKNRRRVSSFVRRVD